MDRLYVLLLHYSRDKLSFRLYLSGKGLTLVLFLYLFVCVFVATCSSRSCHWAQELVSAAAGVPWKVTEVIWVSRSPHVAFQTVTRDTGPFRGLLKGVAEVTTRRTSHVPGLNSTVAHTVVGEHDWLVGFLGCQRANYSESPLIWVAGNEEAVIEISGKFVFYWTAPPDFFSMPPFVIHSSCFIFLSCSGLITFPVIDTFDWLIWNLQ